MIRDVATPSAELEAFREARAEAWRYALACLAENRCEGKEATRPGGPEDAERRSNGIGADKASLPR